MPDISGINEAVYYTKETLGWVKGMLAGDFKVDEMSLRQAESHLTFTLNVLNLCKKQGKRQPKKNPSLVVYGNPPMSGAPFGGMLLHHLGNKNIVGRMSNNVHQIKYEHVDDGEPYVHDFDDGVVMLAVMNGDKKSIFIEGEDGQPLWEDFR